MWSDLGIESTFCLQCGRWTGKEEGHFRDKKTGLGAITVILVKSGKGIYTLSENNQEGQEMGIHIKRENSQDFGEYIVLGFKDRSLVDADEPVRFPLMIFSNVIVAWQNHNPV